MYAFVIRQIVGQIVGAADCPRERRAKTTSIFALSLRFPPKEHHFPPKLARASILVGGWWIPW